MMQLCLQVRVHVRVKCHFTIAQEVFSCLTSLTKFAQITAGFLPPFQIGCSGECVNGGIEEKFQSAFCEIIHNTFPHYVLFSAAARARKFPCTTRPFTCSSHLCLFTAVRVALTESWTLQSNWFLRAAALSPMYVVRPDTGVCEKLPGYRPAKQRSECLLNHKSNNHKK